MNQNSPQNICDCALNYIYKLKPVDDVNGTNIAQFRIELGKQLASMIPPEVIAETDFVVPVPQTGIYYAIGLALAINKPYLPAIVNQSPDQRYLSVTNPDERKKFIRSKLYPIKELVENKRCIVVDEAIFTGLTLKIICEQLQELNIKSIYLGIPTPKCFCKCLHNVMPQKSILLENIREDMLTRYFNVSDIFFQDYDYFCTKMEETFPNTCVSCFKNPIIRSQNV